jgi:Sulfatase-modifying factor enzyme 1/Putative metal-binding motif
MGARHVLALVLVLVGGGCAQRTTQLLQPMGENALDGGSAVTIKLDARPGQSEAGSGFNYDGPTGCTGTPELCNGIDDDCDGVIDNGFNLHTDPLNCGVCGIVCSAPTATTACVAGQCVITGCTPGYVDADKNPVNGCECLLTNGGVEICDGADNDCDGVIDNGFDLHSDPSNCGACGVVCDAANATSSCMNGACGFTCKPGFYDADKKASDGCEYACKPSANPAEVCDGIDNDCNGLIDGDDPGLVYTPADRSCYSSAAGSCQTGLTTCVGGKLVCVGAGPPSEEVCDGRDNNCNGLIDESDPNLGKVCYAPGVAGCDATTGVCVGECKRGALVCTSGSLVCGGMVTPTVEICDGKDNDCDGVIDNGFDTDTDPNNCGGCGHKCSFAHAIAACVQGVCVFDPKDHEGTCADGWVDANHNPSDGCEYQCTPNGPEVCDGKDNDCNGLVDAADPGLIFPANFCLQAGECGKAPGGSAHPGWETSAAFPVCMIPASAPTGTVPSWVCNYPATVQTTPLGQIVAQETWCDGLDNDCNGVVDDAYVKVLGTQCTDPSSTAVGECVRKGTWRCQADKTLPAACDFTGVAPAASPADEICDGLDNDCDGVVDESWDNPPGLAQCGGHDCKGVRDDVVHVAATGAPGGGYYIYKFESSRADASATSQGTSITRACSRAQNGSGGMILPWSSVTWDQADVACRAAGMRLCRATRSGGDLVTDEWGFACQAGQTCSSGVYPYACSYSAAACNGADANLGKAVTCGSRSGCVTVGDLDPSSSSDQVFDMSGNVAEWTDDRRDTGASLDTAIYTTRGGAFDSFFRGMACDFTGTQLHPTFSYPDTGFRCCSSCPAGQADCAGSCKTLGTDSANCGGCGLACGAGTTCQNGACK